MNKKLLFFTSRPPIEPSSGRDTSLYYYCKYLHEMYKFEISIITFSDKQIIDKPYFIEKIHCVKAPGIIDIAKNIIFKTILKGLPIQVSLFYSKNNQKITDYIIESEKPFLLMSDMVRTSEYFKNIEQKKILDMDDLLSRRYKRQLETSGEIVNPFGAYTTKLPKLIGKLFEFEFIKKIILKSEYKLLERYETDISAYYDAVILVSETETNILNDRLGVKKVYTVSTGVDCSNFNKIDYPIVNQNIVSFLGVYSATHNEDAALYFYNEIFPYVKRNRKDVLFRLIGANVTPKILSLKDDTSIEITGKVDDVRYYLASSKVFVAPLRFGSGIKTKIIEAMAMGIPVITTSIGAEGMDVVNFREIIIEDDPKKFADYVCRLLEDEKLYNIISSNGRKFVLNKYDWNIQMKAWENIFSAIDI